ncbi:hypothetical protein ACU4GD_41635 [Cupriavidus basilensis]
MLLPSRLSFPLPAARAVVLVLLSLLAGATQAKETAQGLQDKAMKGDFLAQRNLSCRPAVGLPRSGARPRQGPCMWRKVILLSGDRHVTETWIAPT